MDMRDDSDNACMCEYDEYDDPMTGRVSCIYCGRKWYPTQNEIDANASWHRDIDDGAPF